MKLPAEVFPAPAGVEAPPGLDNLPALPDTFVGRARELEQLDAALSGGGTTVVQAVHGLGGIGKSTLAAYWLATRPHGHAPVRWITADSATGVQQGLADFATALRLGPAQALTVEELAACAVQWLKTHSGWLIVLDNVNNHADIQQLTAHIRNGRFLITSRLATAWPATTTVLRLDVLTPDESLKLLTGIVTAHHPGRSLDGAAEVCEELGHLPLAVEQAAAYIAQNPLTTPRTYLDLLTRHPARMYEKSAVATPAERTIARTWTITLDRIAEHEPTAADLLRTLAWYAPDHIPAALLDAGSTDPAASNHAIGLLNTYSMITADGATGTVAVHRLVQAVARTPDTTDPHRTPHLIDQARHHATTALNNALPATTEAPDTWPTWRTLLPHTDTLTRHTHPDTDTPTTGRLLNQVALFLENQGQPGRAAAYLQRTLASYTRILGADHPDTLTSRNNLASAYQAAGDLGRAIPLHEQNLTDRTRILSP
ncbi:tetratricopeptide repeat protein, partial [Streptantibioticus silvisoli]